MLTAARLELTWVQPKRPYCSRCIGVQLREACAAVLTTPSYLRNGVVSRRSRMIHWKALAKDVGKFRAKSGRGRQALDRSSKQCDPLLQFLWGETEVHAICRKSPTCRHRGLNWADGLYCEIRILGFGRLGSCRRSRGGRGVLGYLLRQELMGQN